MFRLCCWIQIWFLNLIFSPSSCHFEQQSGCLDSYQLCFVLHFACFLFFKLFACRLQHNEFCSNLLFFPMSPVPRNFPQMCSFSPSPQCQVIFIQKVDLKSVLHFRPFHNATSSSKKLCFVISSDIDQITRISWERVFFQFFFVLKPFEVVRNIFSGDTIFDFCGV